MSREVHVRFCESRGVRFPPATHLVIRNDYWADGSLAHQYNGAGHATTYDYDPLGRLVAVTDPLRRPTSYGYDTANNLTTITKPGTASGTGGLINRITLSYDAAHQLTRKSYGPTSDGVITPAVNYTYDANGRRATMTDGTGTTTWSWDPLSRLTATTDGSGASIAYVYDLAGRPTTINYPNGQSVVRHYDAAGRLDAVTDWLGNQTEFTYDASSNVITTTLPSATGTVDTYTYDDNDHLASVTVAAQATQVAEFAYARDVNGQITAENTTNGSPLAASYSYTQLNQLKTVNEASLGYDLADNPTTPRAGQIQAFDVANQVCWSTTLITLGATQCDDTTVPPGATTYSFNDHGDRIRSVGVDGTAIYAYDLEDRLTSVTSTHLPCVTLEMPCATYQYNGDGLRTSKSMAGVEQHHTWDHVQGSLPLVLNDGARSYLYGPDGIPFEQIDQTGNVTWLHHDQLGSIRTASNAAGQVIGTASYDPYGTPTANNALTDVTPFGYAGQYTDAETGFQYLRARYYDPATAQFLTRDPLEATTGQPYAYANNSPLNYTDPSGEIAWFAVAAGLWAVAELGAAVADAVSTAQTFTDPCASGWDKAISGGLFAFGAVAPGGLYSTGARAARAPRAASSIVDDTVHMADDWLGPNVRTITNRAGDKVFLSDDGLRRIRFDIKNPAPHTSPHAHVEEFVNRRWVKSGPIFPQDVPQR